MKKVSVNIMYDSEKLSAIKLYMSQRDMDIKDELEKSVDVLYYCLSGSPALACRTKQPPAMRVRVKGYTKKSPILVQ